MARRKKRKRREQRSFHNPNLPIGQVFKTDLNRSSITTANVFTLSPVWSGVDMVSSDVGRLPINPKVARENGGADVAIDHPTYRLLRRNTGEMTPNIWVTMLTASALLFGNGYSRVIFRDGRPVRIQWLRTSQVQSQQSGGRWFYTVYHDAQKDGATTTERVPREEIIHLRGLSISELGGLSLVDYARKGLERFAAAEDYETDFFENDGTPSGWFRHPGQLSDDAQKRWLAAIQSRHSGTGNRHKFGILEEGMEFQKLGVSPEEAMMINSLEFGVRDIARWLGVPPHKLGDNARTAYNSIEEENRSYFDTTIGKWVDRLQSELTDKLFLPSESRLFIELDVRKMNRADTKTRYEAHQIAIQNGIKSPNEVRAEEGINPYDGGEKYLRPLNITTTDQADQSGTAGVGLVDSDDSRSIIFWRDLLAERLFDGLKLLANASEKASRKKTPFLSSINDLEKDYRETLAAKYRATIAAIAHHTGGDESELVERCVSDSIQFMTARMVSASECMPEELPAKIKQATKNLDASSRAMASEILEIRGTTCKSKNDSSKEEPLQQMLTTMV